MDQVDPDHLASSRPDGNYLPPGPQNPIGPVQGYPETGKDAWRMGNDDAITAAAAKYNSANGYQPGDPRYMTPQVMKSWEMQESGGTRHAFETDPFQVNNPGDWPKDNAKATVAGLTQGQTMTPQTSADAALKWFQYKATDHNPDGSTAGYKGLRGGLMNYNGNNTPVDGVPFKNGYADAILNRARDSYGNWQK